MNLLKKLFQVRTCGECNKGWGETSFASKGDELCNVCQHYKYGEEIICCEHSIILYHGDPELCSICGTPWIMWGNGVYQGTPFVAPPEMFKYKIYIPLILYRKDGFEEYIDRAERIASKITNEELAEFYKEFYLLHANSSKKERERIQKYYR